MLRRFTHTLLRGCGRGVKTQANELRSGQVLIIDGKLLEVVKAEHTQGQGRMSGHVQLEARDLRSGSKRVERLRPSDTVERVLIARQIFTFLYNDGRAALLMHPDTFEQVSVPHALFNGMERFLQEGGSVDVASVDGDGEAGEVVQATLPDTIQAVIKSTAASMKVRSCQRPRRQRPCSISCSVLAHFTQSE